MARCTETEESGGYDRMTLVNLDQIQRDPRKLPYLYPKMPASRYKELSETYHRCLTILALEKVSAMFGAVLIPSSCVHHDRRRADRRIMVHGRTYYVMDETEVTPLEWAKYKAICPGDTGAISSGS